MTSSARSPGSLFLDRLVHGLVLLVVVAGYSSFISCTRDDPSDEAEPAERISAPAIVAPGTDLGAVPGRFSVTPAGTSAYTIPLFTPDGRNGLAPSLSLNYASARGDNPAGLGWSLDGGFSMIHRCGTGPLRAERASQVAFDNSKDRLCLDGRPLVPVGGTHGFAGAEYRTEPDSFTKVVIEAADARGPIRLTVYTRDTLIHSYGSVGTVVNSSLAVAGALDQWSVRDTTSRDDGAVFKSAPVFTYAWLRGATIDRFANQIVYKYRHPAGRDQPGTPQEPLLEFIDYVDVNGGPFRSRSIKLNYVERPAAARRITFVGGMRFASNTMLRSIDVRVAAPGTQTLRTVRFYDLTHEVSAATARPLLTQVKECDGSAATAGCKRPTVFTYSLGGDIFRDAGVAIPGMSPGEGGASRTVQPADVNGDGREDVIVGGPRTGVPDRTFIAFLGNEAGALQPMGLNLTADGTGGDLVIADFAGGDGRPDFAVPLPGNSFAYYRNEGVGPGPGVRVSFLGFDQPASRGVAIGDFSGKGSPSILRALGNGEWGVTHVPVGAPAGELPEVTAGLGAGWPLDFETAGWSSYAADVDLDGAVELLTPGAGTGSRLGVLRQKRVGDRRAPPDPADWGMAAGTTTLLTSRPGDVVKHVFFDFNGDGLPDALRLRQGRRVPDLIINTGRGFAAPQPLTALAGTSGNVQLGPGTEASDLDDPGIRVLDFDGDGRDDILLVDDGTIRDSSAATAPKTRSNLVVLLSRGEGLVARTLAIPVGQPGTGTRLPRGIHVRDWRLTQLLDFNGDGLRDIFHVGAGAAVARVFLRDGTPADMLRGVKDGMGHKTGVTYRPMSDPAVYTAAPEGTCSLPQVCVTGPEQGVGGNGWLVRGYRVDNGVGNGQNEYTFHYQDGRYDQSGAGSLGFGRWIWTDVARGTSVIQTYDLEARGKVRFLDGTGGAALADVYSQLAVPAEERVEVAEFVNVGGRPIRQVLHTTTTTFRYDFVQTNGGASYYTRPRFVTTNETEFRAGLPVLMSTINQEMVYDPDLDDFGITSGVINMVTTHGSAPATTITEARSSDFANVPDRWLLGLETSRTTTSTAASGESETRRVDYQNDPETGAVVTTIVEPEDTTKLRFLRVDYTRFSSGQLHTIRRSDRDGNSRLDTIEYDGHGLHPARYINALEHVTTVNLDPGLGLVQSLRDPNNATTSYDYDTFGRLRRLRRPGGGGLAISYARDIEAGSAPAEERFVARVTTTVEGGGELRTVVNRLGQEIRRESRNLDGTFSFTQSTYDAIGLLESINRPAAVGSPAGPATTFRYDRLGRLTTRIRPEDGVAPSGTRATASAAFHSYGGFHTTATDDFGRATVFQTNAAGQLLRSESRNDDGQILVTDYTYKPFGALGSVVRRNGTGQSHRFTEMDYDGLGRRITVNDPDMGVRQTEYNAFGEVIEERDAKAQVTTYVRDALGRVTERHDADSLTTFIWDTAANGKGQIAETNSPSGVKRQYFYDSFGRPSRELWTVFGQSFQLDFAYDSAGRVQKVSYPSTPGGSRFVARNVYDPESGELSRVQNDTTNALYWELKATAADSQILQEAFGNRVVTDYQYTPSTGRLDGITSTRPGAAGAPPTTVRSWGYDYFTDGNLKRRSDRNAGRHEAFTYDSLNRVKTWSAADSSGAPLAGGWNVRYTVDDFGNLTRRNFTAGTATGGASQDLTYEIQLGFNRARRSFLGNYDYDANGNQITRPGDERVFYTAFDLPRVITGPRPASFQYDAGGFRTLKRTTAMDTVYIGGIYEKRITPASVDHIFHVTAGARVVAEVVRREGGAESVRYLHADRLGSIDAISDAAGTVVEQPRLDPYGNTVTDFNQPRLPTELPTPPAPGGNRLGFTGHEHDPEHGLINMRGRVYDPRLGRFLTTDPFVQAPALGQSYNRYAYVFNNPVNFVDPSGFLADLVVRDPDMGPDGGFRPEGDRPEVVRVHEDVGPRPPPTELPPGTTVPPKGQGPAPVDPTGIPGQRGTSGGGGRDRASDVADGTGNGSRSLPSLTTLDANDPSAPAFRTMTAPGPDHDRKTLNVVDILRNMAAPGSGFREALSIGVSLIPGVSLIKSVVEVGTGYDFLAGRDTSRAMAGIGIAAALLPGASALLKGAAAGAKFARGAATAAPGLRVDVDLLAQYAAHVPSSSGGYFNVVTHADSSAAWVLKGGNWQSLSHRTLARFIEGAEGYNRGAVRLIGCDAGACATGLAQNLANKLGVEVLAPTEKVFVDAVGSFWTTGVWRSFVPRR